MVSTVKHGGVGIMVWGCMAALGVENFVVINCVMNHLYYIEILKENLGASAEKLGIEDYQFYQDNDPKHSKYKALAAIQLSKSYKNTCPKSRPQPSN
ncbi:hypothetical protein TNCV_3664641 [Trichonephila clavipes]|nr:hypothetical protein TNCV_3664641 [Trichonephila clavipes]